MRPSTGLAIIGAILALVCGIEILAHGHLSNIDDRVAWNYWPITQTRTTRVSVLLAHVGMPSIAGAVVGALGALVSLLTRRVAGAAAAMVGLGMVGLSTLILKQVFPRPSIVGHLPGSFPSGHTGVAVVASGLVVWLLLPAVGWRNAATLAIGGLWGALMGWGRLVTDAHWLSDVLAGWGIGMVALVLALRTADSPLGRRGWARPAPADR